MGNRQLCLRTALFGLALLAACGCGRESTTTGNSSSTDETLTTPPEAQLLSALKPGYSNGHGQPSASVHITSCTSDKIVWVSKSVAGVPQAVEYGISHTCTLSNSSICTVSYIEGWYPNPANPSQWRQVNFDVQDGCAEYGE
jgi:hypothetical protein